MASFEVLVQIEFLHLQSGHGSDNELKQIIQNILRLKHEEGLWCEYLIWERSITRLLKNRIANRYLIGARVQRFLKCCDYKLAFRAPCLLGLPCHK
ncbi:hypothetical protein CEXT_737141 [Caerostris extrusa]|uniref:Uncharacterized protein n=1 Tax=Caerostris extrusa TaxID=172846 RepID=A0AAV4URL1_CAEEX|nr:hypothetical protein CEXT_737141 [Caerostris extrusa]